MTGQNIFPSNDTLSESFVLR